MYKGLILKGIGGFYEVVAQPGVFSCKARGAFRKKGLSPMVGDNVMISITDLDGKLGSIEEILPRKNEFKRPPVANMDQMVIVASIDNPKPDFVLLDKMLITAQEKGLNPLICINKTDLSNDVVVEKCFNEYSLAGYPLVRICAKSEHGLDGLHMILTSKITVFAGQSGVGKSTILNRVVDEWIMETGTLSEKLQRGRHTTRHAQLLPLDCGGYVVDTPGFSSFELENVRFDELDSFYPEFSGYIGRCKFNGCSHITEPECRIKEALQNDKIPRERYQRYSTYYHELKEQYNNRYRR